MNIQTDISELLAELDACRASRGLSRKAVADACGVSEATISRAFNLTGDPSYKLLQDIAAAVQYKPEDVVIVPEDTTQEAYVAYLRELLQKQREDSDRRVRQLQAHYNMLLAQSRREKNTWMILALVLAGVFVILFLYDFAHLDRGWIQAIVNGYRSAAVDTLLAVVDWMGKIWA